MPGKGQCTAGAKDSLKSASKIHGLSPSAIATRRSLILFFAAVLAGAPVYATDSENAEARQEEGPEGDGDDPGFFLRSLQSVERQRDIVGGGYVWLARGIDDFFTDEGDEIVANESYLKLDLRHTFEESGESITDVRVKAKLDLPNTEDRVKLAFSSDERQDESLEQRVRPVSTGERIQRESSVAELQVQPRSEWRRWKRKGSLGIRTRTPPVPFGRYRLTRAWELSPLWRSEFQQEFWYFDDRGWGETSELTFWRPLSDSLLLRFWGEAEFRDETDRFDYVEIASVVHRLSERSGLEYRVGVLGASRPNLRLNAFFWGLSYRLRVHEDWVFLSATPELFYPREEGWSAEPSFTLRLEVYFF